MPSDSLITARKILLACDARFGHPDAFNDQVWEARLHKSSVKPISFFTTFGLRSRSMLLYPVFSKMVKLMSQENEIIAEPQITFRTTNFIELAFSPFISIDVILRVWVPASQVLVGQVWIKNSSTATETVEMDWIARLDHTAPGKPMVLEQMGINKVLCGQTGGLFPLFYLSGGPEESSSADPGLHTRSVLAAGADRQVTWVMAAMDSAEGSLQNARQYSSRLLDLEKLKMEMEDRRSFVQISHPESPQPLPFADAQIQAHQLIMPGVNAFLNHTYTRERTPLTPTVSDARFPQLSPAWSGQTLPMLHFLSQVFLPGNPTLLAQLVMNELDAQSEDGSIDMCVNAGNQPTGILAPPLLCSLVERLIPYISDQGWFVNVYPRLENFMHKWVNTEGNPGFTHPLQTGFFEYAKAGNDSSETFWLKLSSTRNPFLLSLLFKEGKSLLNIARKAGISPSGWVADATEQIHASLQSLWDEQTASFSYREILSGESHPGLVLAEFSGEEKIKISNRIKPPCTLYVKLQHESSLPSDFNILIAGRAEGKICKVQLNRRNFVQLGDTHLAIIREPYTAISFLQVKGSPEPIPGLFGIIDLTQTDITSFMPLWAGFTNPDQATKLLQNERFTSFMDETGLWLETGPGVAGNSRVPDFLASFIIEGLLEYGHPDLAMEAYQKHFLSNYSIKSRSLEIGKITSLIPILLYLGLNGIREIAQKELILQSSNTPVEPVTVQYGQMEFTIKPNLLILKVPGEAPLVIKTAEPQRIRLG